MVTLSNVSVAIEQAAYTRGEVTYLLSLSHTDAVLGSTIYAALAGDSDGRQGQDFGDHDVPLIARWAEVHRARGRIVTEKRDLAMTQLRLQGYTEDEIAEVMQVSRRTVGRSWRATIAEVLAALGGEREVTERLDHVDLCLGCGERPRTRVMRRVRVLTQNGWRWQVRDSPSSRCRQCLNGRATAIV